MSEFYATPGRRLPATQLLVEFHFPGSARTVWSVLDSILADGYRVFSVEPNYYCNNGCCAKDLIGVAIRWLSCVPRLDLSYAKLAPLPSVHDQASVSPDVLSNVANLWACHRMPSGFTAQVAALKSCGRCMHISCGTRS